MLGGSLDRRDPGRAALRGWVWSPPGALWGAAPPTDGGAPARSPPLTRLRLPLPPEWIAGCGVCGGPVRGVKPAEAGRRGSPKGAAWRGGAGGCAVRSPDPRTGRSRRRAVSGLRRSKRRDCRRHWRHRWRAKPRAGPPTFRRVNGDPPSGSPPPFPPLFPSPLPGFSFPSTTPLRLSALPARARACLADRSALCCAQELPLPFPNAPDGAPVPSLLGRFSTVSTALSRASRRARGQKPRPAWASARGCPLSAPRRGASPGACTPNLSPRRTGVLTVETPRRPKGPIRPGAPLHGLEQSPAGVRLGRGVCFDGCSTVPPAGSPAGGVGCAN